jgi:hypothetical protein
MRRIDGVRVQQRLKAREDYLDKEEILATGMIYKTLIRKIKDGELEAVYVGRDLFITKESWKKGSEVRKWERRTPKVENEGEETEGMDEGETLFAVPKRKYVKKAQRLAEQSAVSSVESAEVKMEWEALRAERSALRADWEAMRLEREAANTFLSHAIRLVEVLFKTIQIDFTPEEKSRLLEKLAPAGKK